MSLLKKITIVPLAICALTNQTLLFAKELTPEELREEKNWMSSYATWGATAGAGIGVSLGIFLNPAVGIIIGGLIGLPFTAASISFAKERITEFSKSLSDNQRTEIGKLAKSARAEYHLNETISDILVASLVRNTRDAHQSVSESEAIEAVLTTLDMIAENK